jgi:PAS domain-containing protein
MSALSTPESSGPTGSRPPPSRFRPSSRMRAWTTWSSRSAATRSCGAAGSSPLSPTSPSSAASKPACHEGRHHPVALGGEGHSRGGGGRARGALPLPRLPGRLPLARLRRRQADALRPRPRPDDASARPSGQACDGDGHRKGRRRDRPVWDSGKPAFLAIDGRGAGSPSAGSGAPQASEHGAGLPNRARGSRARRARVLPARRRPRRRTPHHAVGHRQPARPVRGAGPDRKGPARERMAAHAPHRSRPAADLVGRPDGEVDFYSSRHADYAGFSRNADGSWNWTPVIHPDDAAPTIEAWRDGGAHRRALRDRAPDRGADGSFRWHLSRALPLRDDSGAIARWYGSATDIHALKSAQGEAERLLSERQVILETMAQGLAVIALDGSFTYVNPAGRRILGWTDPTRRRWATPPGSGARPRELDGTPMPPHLMPHARAIRGERVRGQMVRMALPAGRGRDPRLRRRAASRRRGRLGGRHRDLRRRDGPPGGRRGLRQSEARLKATFEGVADGIITFDAAGRIMNFNHAFARMHGFPSGAERGPPRLVYGGTRGADARRAARSLDGMAVPAGSAGRGREGPRTPGVPQGQRHPGYIGSFTPSPSGATTERSSRSS